MVLIGDEHLELLMGIAQWAQSFPREAELQGRLAEEDRETFEDVERALEAGQYALDSAKKN